MCWSAPVSLATFITSLVMCVYIWKRNYKNDKALAIFIVWFSFMQLFEFFMWRDMKGHTLSSKLSLIFILLQPLVLAAGLYYYTGSLYKYWEKWILGIIILISAIKALSAAIYAFIINTEQKWLSVKGPNCHLIWWFFKNFNNLPRVITGDAVYFFLLFLALVMIKPLSDGLFYSGLALLTLFLTRTFYPKEFGSLWCWAANFFALFVIFMPRFKRFIQS
jgi:hypothetical protein